MQLSVVPCVLDVLLKMHLLGTAHEVFLSQLGRNFSRYLKCYSREIPVGFPGKLEVLPINIVMKVISSWKQTLRETLAVFS